MKRLYSAYLLVFMFCAMAVANAAENFFVDVPEASLGSGTKSKRKRSRSHGDQEMPIQEDLVTPQKPTSNELQELHITPAAKSVLVTNYCRKMIEALARDDAQEFKNQLTYFYRKLPYSVYNFHKPPNKADDRRSKIKDLHAACAYLLCFFLTNSKASVVRNDKKDIIWTAIQSDKNIYVLQFCADHEKEEEHKIPLYKYKKPKKNSKPVIVIAVSFLIDKEHKRSLLMHKIDNTGLVNQAIAPAQLTQARYDEKLNEGRQMVIDIADKDKLKNNLEKIYNMIPPTLRVAKERYYQSILFFIIILYRYPFACNEVETSEGRIDISFDSGVTKMIVEFKHNEADDNAALNQIKNKQYHAFIGDTEKVCLMSINVKDDKDNIKKDGTSIGVDIFYVEEQPTPPGNI